MNQRHIACLPLFAHLVPVASQSAARYNQLIGRNSRVPSSTNFGRDQPEHGSHIACSLPHW